MYRLRSDNGSSVVIDTPKTVNSNRTIPLPKFLNKYVELFRGNPDEYVLSSKRLSIVEPRLMQIKFKKMTQECNFENVTFHTLRHTFATRCVECGFDIKSLSEILGHADVKTTLNKYVHSSMELKQSNMDKLEKIAI
jgi:integrase